MPRLRWGYISPRTQLGNKYVYIITVEIDKSREIKSISV